MHHATWKRRKKIYYFQNMLQNKHIRILGDTEAEIQKLKNPVLGDVSKMLWCLEFYMPN